MVENEERYRQFVENAREAIYVVQDGKVAFANAAAIELAQRPRERLLGTAVEDFARPEDRERVRAHHGDVLSGKVSASREEFFFRRPEDGLERWLLVSAVRIDWEGRPATLNFATDVTETRAAAEALRRSQEFLRQSQEVARVGGWRANPETDFLVWTDGVRLLLEVPPDYRPGLEEGLRFYHSEDLPAIREAVGRAYKEGLPFTLEVRVITTTGKTLWTELRGLRRVGTGREAHVLGTLQDITERKRVEEALWQSEQKYRGIFDESVAAIFIFDTEKRFVNANQAGLDLLGYSREELLRMRMRDADVAPEDVLPAHRQLFEGGRLVNYEHQLRRKDGSVVTVLNNSRPLKDAQGNVTGLLSTLVDITERKRAEQALQRSEETLSRLFDTSPAPIAVSTFPEGRILQGNDAFYRIIGYSREEVLGKTTRELGIWVDPGVRETITHAAARGENPAPIEVRGRRKDGGEFEVLLAFAPLSIEGHLHILSVGVDITERKQAERALAKAVGRYQQMLSQQYHGILVVSQDEKVEYVNERFCEMLGLEGGPSRFVGLGAAETIARVVPSYADPEAIRQRIRELVEGRHAVFGEEIRMRDGRVFLADFVPLEVNGVPSGRMWVHRDVTQERALQAQLLQAQKLDTVGQLAGGIAHDFNNLLMVFGGCASLLLKRLREGSPLRPFAEDIRQAVGRGTAITQQLLSLSRHQVGQPRPLDLNHLLGEVRKMAKHLIREHVEVVLRPSEESLWLVADHNQVLQVLMNLVVNARDAMPSGGRLRIEAFPFDLAQPDPRFPDAGPDRYAGIAVADTGCGMGPEVRARIFEPFFTTKARGKGTGLGLSIVYNIVQQARGHVHVESRVGQGSTFTLLFPRCPRPRASEGDLETNAPAPRGTETILLAEDDPKVRQVVRLILAEQGYRVVAAKDGAEAWRTFEERPSAFPIVVSDVIMPHLNGLDLIRRVRQKAPSTRLLLMSGYSDADVMQQVLTEEGVTFLPKPVDAGLLLRRIRESLGVPPVAGAKRPDASRGVRKAGRRTPRGASAPQPGSSPGGTGKRTRGHARSSRRTPRRSR
jgi:PAS domain S-box-containing protein